MPTRFELYQIHAKEWDGCMRCELGEHACNTVLGKGTTPCDILFIGEGPGSSEDAQGIPFIGEAGQLLDYIIEEANIKQTFAMTNLVACKPLDDEHGNTGTPDDDQIQTCAPRLIEMVTICSPKLIVCVGGLARDYIMKEWKRQIKLNVPQGTEFISIIHPSHIIRKTEPAAKPLLIRKQIVTIQNAIHRVFNKRIAIPIRRNKEQE